MEHQTSQCKERERIADFIALSADYIGVTPPSEHTFARWTANCICQQPRTPDQLSR
ncbi:hypothetical protein [Sedimenticola thiotaurini]|uniref:hypothetical protein n=1 Tax=Sedimenticola thiotaurini TaxID=1543721 RepID=UPI0018FF32CB|nr:hypothetical protein [Sedimenticola thiotaurini]